MDQIIVDISMAGLEGGCARTYENVMPTITSREYKDPRMVCECERLGNAYDDEKYTGGNFGGNVWNQNGLAPAMKTGASASQQCIVETKAFAMRGRENGQQLEERKDGCSNEITTVQKDNLIVESEGLQCLSRAEQSRAEQHNPCSTGNEGRLHSLQCRRSCGSDLSRQQNEERKSDRERRSITDSDNGEHP